jgi:hypothetical protein
MVFAQFLDGFSWEGNMSRKLLVLCFLLGWGSLGSAQTAEVNDGVAPEASTGHFRRPLDKAKAVLNRNEQAHPQSQGLENAIEHVNANQERFIEKHLDGPSVSDRADRGGPERPNVARPDIPRGPLGVDRPDRSARRGR